MDKPDSALNYYKRAFDKVDFIHWVNLDKAMKCCNTTKIKLLGDEFEEIKDKQIESIDLNYKSLIDSLIKEDQRVRSRQYTKAKEFFFKSEYDSTFSDNERKYLKAKNLMKEWWAIDSLNMVILKQSINIWGFPSEKKVGADSYLKACVILAHYDKDTANHIMGKILQKALEEGLLLPRDYAWIVDRHLVSAGKKQLYMSIPFGQQNLGSEKLESINKSRNEIGLEHMIEANIIGSP